MKKRDISAASVERDGGAATRACRPCTDGASTTTRSPACSPFSTIQRLPTRRPSVTVLTLTLLSGVDDAQLKAALQLGDRALRHEQRVLCAPPSAARTRPYWPGRRTLPGFGNVALTRIVPIFGSTSRSTASTEPACG